MCFDDGNSSLKKHSANSLSSHYQEFIIKYKKCDVKYRSTPPNFTSCVLILQRIWAYKIKCSEAPLAVQWLRFHTPRKGVRAKTPHAMVCCHTLTHKIRCSTLPLSLDHWSSSSFVSILTIENYILLRNVLNLQIGIHPSQLFVFAYITLYPRF